VNRLERRRVRRVPRNIPHRLKILAVTRTRLPGHERDTARKRFPVRRDGIASHPLATATVSSPTTIVSAPASPAASNGAPLTRNRPPGQCAAPASAGEARRRSETRVARNRRGVADRSVARAGVAAAWIGSAPPKSSRSRGSRRPGHSRRDVGGLLDMAQARWRRLDGAHLLPAVRAGIAFVDGVQQANKGRRTRREAA
jgi:hypothetical protein